MWITSRKQQVLNTTTHKRFSTISNEGHSKTDDSSSKSLNPKLEDEEEEEEDEEKMDLNAKAQEIWNLFLEGQKRRSLDKVPVEWWQSVLSIWKFWKTNADVENLVSSAFEEMRKTVKSKTGYEVCYEIVAEMYLRRVWPVTSERVNLALSVLRLMKENDKLNPSTSNVNDLLEALYDLKRNEEAEKLFQNYLQRPSIRTFNILIRNAQNLKHAQQLYSEISKRGLKANAETERLMLEKRMTDPQLEDVYQNMLQIFPNLTPQRFDELKIQYAQFYNNSHNKINPQQILQHFEKRNPQEAQQVKQLLSNWKQTTQQKLNQTLHQFKEDTKRNNKKSIYQ